MILITGATGNFGKLAIDFLLEKGIPANEIAALVREETKEEGLTTKAEAFKAKGVAVKTGDYSDYPSLVKAFKGVDKLLFISASGSNEISSEELQANVVRAAKEADVKHIFYTSTERKDDTDASPFAYVANAFIATENLIKESGITYTIFRDNLYLEILPLFFGEKLLENGIFFPAGDTVSAFTSRNDQAEAAVNVIVGDGHENKIYSFSNTDKVSLHDIAGYISDASGKTINYINPTAEEYTEVMNSAGVPADNVNFLKIFAETIKQGGFNTPKTDLEQILGRPPVSAKTFFTKMYSEKK